MKIPFMRLDRQFEQHKDTIMTICERVFSHGKVLQGPEIDALEAKLCEVMRTKNAVAVGSATDALFFALLTSGVQPGDKVAVPTMTFVASASPVIRANAKPVFVDSGKNFQPDITKTIDLVNAGEVQAVIAVHLFGQLFDIKPLADACRSNNVPLIEDAAQAIGANLNDQIPGSHSSAASLSFDPMKVAGAFGSGGAIVTNDDEIAKRIRQLRYHGRDDSRIYRELGYNSQMASIQAGIINFKLDHLNEWATRRQSIARRYTSVLDELSQVTTPIEQPGETHVFHKYVMTVRSDRNKLRQHLSDAGIGTMVHYGSPLHNEPVFSTHLKPDAEFPEAERFSKEALSLPIYPELHDSEVDQICRELKKFNW